MNPENIDAIIDEVYENYLNQEENSEEFLKRFEKVSAPYVDADGKVNNRDLLKVCCIFSIVESRKSTLKMTAEVLKRILVQGCE